MNLSRTTVTRRVSIPDHFTTRRLIPGLAVACGLALWTALLTDQAHGQYLLDNNLQEGTGGINAPQPEPDYDARNAIITGNVPGLGYFRGRVPYRAPGEFGDRLGSDDLFRFRAVSAGPTSAVAPGTTGYRPGQVRPGGSADAFQNDEQVLLNQPGAFLREGSGVSIGQLEAAGYPSQGYLPPRGAQLPTVADQTILSGSADLQGIDRRLGVSQMPDGRLLEVRASPVSGVRMLSQGSQLDPQTEALLREAQRSATGPTAAQIADLKAAGIEPRDLARMPGVVLGNQLQSALLNQSYIRRSPVGVGRATPSDPPGEGLVPDGASGAALPTAAPGLSLQLRRALLQRQNAAALEQIDPAYGALMRRMRQAADGQDAQPLPPGLVGDNAGDAGDGAAGDPADAADPDDPFGLGLPRVTQEQLDRAARLRINALRRVAGQEPLGPDEPLPDGDDAAEPLGLSINEDRLDPELLVLLRAVRDSGVELESLTMGDAKAQGQSQVDRLMASAERAFAEQRYFDAAETYRTIQSLAPDHTMARVGQLHGELAAGMFRTAGRTLRQLAADRPEVLGTRYADKLLPPQDRMINIQQQLLDLLGFSGEPDAGLLLAYMGYQSEAPRLVQYGLSLAQSRAPNDPLIPLLAAVWLEQDAAE